MNAYSDFDSDFNTVVFTQDLGYAPATGLGLTTVSALPDSNFAVTLPLLAAASGPYTVAVDWGDGHTGNESPITGTSYTLSHEYTATGNFPVTITYRGGAGPAVTENFTVNVAASSTAVTSSTAKLLATPPHLSSMDRGSTSIPPRIR